KDEQLIMIPICTSARPVSRLKEGKMAKTTVCPIEVMVTAANSSSWSVKLVFSWCFNKIYDHIYSYALGRFFRQQEMCTSYCDGFTILGLPSTDGDVCNAAAKASDLTTRKGIAIQASTQVINCEINGFRHSRFTHIQQQENYS